VIREVIARLTTQEIDLCSVKFQLPLS